MRFDRVLRILFVLYCVEAGALLLFVPWSSTWDRLILSIPSSSFHDLGLGTVARALTSAFGMVHLVWGAQDLADLVLRRRRP